MKHALYSAEAPSKGAKSRKWLDFRLRRRAKEASAELRKTSGNLKGSHKMLC